MKKIFGFLTAILLSAQLCHAGATFSRVKNWISGETLTASDLNAEFDNILNNLDPTGIDDYSGSNTDMRQVTDPYPSLSESLATSLKGEIERLRYQILQLKSAIAISSNTYWYQDVPGGGTFVIANNKVGIHTNNPTAGFHVNTDMTASSPTTINTLTSNTITFTDDSTQMNGMASQTVMEAAAASGKAATAASTKYHPGVAKAWVVFAGSGTPTILAGYNVSSITDNGTGDYTVNFTNSFSGTNYSCAGLATWKSGVWSAAVMQDETNLGSTTAGAYRINVRDFATSLTVDAARVQLVCYGDQ